VWQDITGFTEAPNSGHTAALAIGIPQEGAADAYLIRAGFVLDVVRRGVILQAAIPAGTKVMLHHRTVEDVLDGARRLARHLEERLRGKTARAVIGFECGARTKPFLGEEATYEENCDLQDMVAPGAAWAGAIVWGEVFPVGGKPAFHNYTYPLVVVAD
jgi:small ligand-binding sensory domain FIST